MKVSEKMTIIYGIIIFIFMIIIFSKLTSAQDTTKVISDSSNIVQSIDTIDIIDEVVLDAITIEAEIEKPRVAILPKRIEPELGEMEFINRSFENELKQGPEQPVLIKERIRAPIKVKKLKEKKVKSK